MKLRQQQGVGGELIRNVKKREAIPNQVGPTVFEHHQLFRVGLFDSIYASGRSARHTCHAPPQELLTPLQQLLLKS